MTALFSRLLAVIALLALSGCAYGWIYTSKTEPFVRDMKETRIGSKMAELSSKEVHEPLTGVGVGVAWSSRAIGEAAKRKGITDVYFADMYTRSFFGGIFRMETIQVYGD